MVEGNPCLWRLMGLVFCAALSLRVTITSLGPLMAMVADELHLSKGMVSLVISIPMICMGVCALLAKPLSDRLGLERTITLCLFVVALATFFRTSVPNFYLLLLMSFIMGTGIAIAGPLVSGYVKRHFGAISARGMMLYSLGISFSGLLGTMGSWIFTEYLALNWTVALEIWAIPIFLIAVYWGIYYLFPKSITRQAETTAKLPWSNKRVWLLVSCFGLQSGIFYTFLAWIIPYFVENGVDRIHANILLNIFMCNAPLGSLFFPFLLARFGKEIAVYTCSLTVIAMLFLLAIAPDLIPFFAIFILGMTANAGLFIVVLSLPFYEVENGNEVASWTAMILAIGYILAAAIPAFFGFLYDVTNSYSNVMWGLLICAVIMHVCFVLFLQTGSSKRMNN